MSTYLDCAATSPVDPRVVDCVMRWLRDECGNPGSRTHEQGTRARRAVERARDQVAAATGAGRAEVIFTSGATEANNLAILGLAEHGIERGLRHLVSTRIEHHAVLEPLEALRRRGFETTLVAPTRGGWVDAHELRAAMRPDTLLVSVMHVNNETGVIQPLEAIATALGDHPAYLHVDAAQGFGRQPAALRHPRIDLISISGHKIHAPMGIGALIARRRQGTRPPLRPLMFGGGQELGLRPGTLPVHLIAGLGLAAELVTREVQQRNEAASQYRRQLLEGLAPLRPALLGDQDRVVPQILCAAFPGLHADEVVERLAGLVCISIGAACTTQSRTCSHVLEAMGVDGETAAGAVRFSWCHTTPAVDWARVVDLLRSD